MWLWFYLYEFNWQKWNEKKKKQLCCLIHCCHFAVVVKQLCDLCKKGRRLQQSIDCCVCCDVSELLSQEESRGTLGAGGSTEGCTVHLRLLSAAPPRGAGGSSLPPHSHLWVVFHTPSVDPNRNVRRFTVTSYISITSSLHICYESVLWCQAKGHSATGSSLTQGCGFG